MLTVRRNDPDRLSDVCDRRCANALSVAHSMLPTHTIVNVCDAFHAEFQSAALRRYAIRSVPDRGGAYQSTGDDAPVANLRSAVLTPKGLAAELAIAPQTATALMRELRAAKLVTEITGRRSFRAFAITSP